MKPRFLISLALTLSACLPASTLAVTQRANGITWTYQVEYEKAIIESEYRLESAIPVDTKGAVSVPSKLGGYPVTTIGMWAFYNCSGITSITIPEGVSGIRHYAFFGCTGMGECFDS